MALDPVINGLNGFFHDVEMVMQAFTSNFLAQFISFFSHFKMKQDTSRKDYNNVWKSFHCRNKALLQLIIPKSKNKR